VNDSVSACRLKEEYIKLYAPEIVRYGSDRLINLTNYNADFGDRELNDVVKMFETYLNTMFVGDNSLVAQMTEITTSAAPMPSVEHSMFFEYEAP
jgi:hypothetical protein